MTTYTCIINETQRLRIVRALELLDAQSPLTPAELDDPDLEYLLPCLTDLPTQEADSPGIHHGLCL